MIDIHEDLQKYPACLKFVIQSQGKYELVEPLRWIAIGNRDKVTRGLPDSWDIGELRLSERKRNKILELKSSCIYLRNNLAQGH